MYTDSPMAAQKDTTMGNTPAQTVTCSKASPLGIYVCPCVCYSLDMQVMITSQESVAHQGNGDEHGGGDGADDVRPDTGAVHEPLEEGQAALEQGAVLVGQHHLEVPLQELRRDIRVRSQQGCFGL